ncbi:spondin domain-containing protein [Rubrivirga sp.]|uniref:spondin domain-containing protein n=1 Tax=Rubrivirga sp. TaxID=1885344 RepID=UPI003B529995
MRLAPLALLVPLLLVGCDSTDDDNDTPRTFTVTLENVSTPGTVAGDRAMGAVPLSPPAWAVFTGNDPMFRSGQLANLGTERIAEDGFPDEMVAILNAASNVSASGVETSPGGADMGPAVFPALGGAAAESVTFTFTARPGDRLQLETMFVQSNDWFYAFSDGGLELFDDGEPISGDVTSRLSVYDAGTEEDTAPGTGPTAPPGPVQKPVQDPMATNVGTDESVPVATASSRHSFAIPANDRVIRVTVSAR